jgi:hypothetical protein
MRTIPIATLLLAAALAASACVWTGAISNTGPSLFVASTKEPVLATEAIDATSTGEACSYNWFGIVSAGDSSIDAAKKDGDITQVASVDKQYLNILFLWGRACTIVKGK